MKCSPSISRAAIACSAYLALLACPGSLDHPERFNLGSGPDAGPVEPSSDGGCDPVTDIFPPSCTASACHSTQSQQGSLDLEAPGLPKRLVDKRAHGGPGYLIDSSNPSQSELFLQAPERPPFPFQHPPGAPPPSPDER